MHYAFAVSYYVILSLSCHANAKRLKQLLIRTNRGSNPVRRKPKCATTSKQLSLAANIEARCFLWQILKANEVNNYFFAEKERLQHPHYEIKYLKFYKNRFFLLFKIAKNGERLVTNLALMTQPAVPTKLDRICFFLCALLKSEKCLIAKTVTVTESRFRFQAFFALCSAITFQTPEPLATSYPLKCGVWLSAKWRLLEAPFSRF